MSAQIQISSSTTTEYDITVISVQHLDTTVKLTWAFIDDSGNYDPGDTSELSIITSEWNTFYNSIIDYCENHSVLSKDIPHYSRWLTASYFLWRNDKITTLVNEYIQ